MDKFDKLKTTLKIGDNIYKGLLVQLSDVKLITDYVEHSTKFAFETFLNSNETNDRLDHELYLLKDVSKAIATLALFNMKKNNSSLLFELAIAKQIYLQTLLKRLEISNVFINNNGGIMPLQENYEKI